MAQRVSAPDTALQTTGGGGGSAVTVADGADVTQGAKADAAVSNPASSGSVVSLLKGLLTLLAGNLSIGNFPATQAASIAAGNDVTEGNTTDAAVVGDNNGTVSAKLRGLSKIFNDVWDSVNHFLLVKATQNGTWTVTSNAGTNLNTSALALESGGNLAAAKADLDTIVTNTGNIGKTQTSGGSTPFHALSAASNNATSVKASAGQLYGICISNTNAAARFFKLYNKASAPAPATDNALIVLTVQIPANATVALAFPEGMAFSTGIAFAAVVNISDTDNTAIGSNDLSMDLRYK